MENIMNWNDLGRSAREGESPVQVKLYDLAVS